MQEVAEEVIRQLSQVAGIPVERIRPAHRIDQDLKVDPDDIDYTLHRSLERRFGVTISAEGWGRVITVQDVIDTVSKEVAGGSKRVNDRSES